MRSGCSKPFGTYNAPLLDGFNEMELFKDPESKWHGWKFYQDYLVDPDENRYTVEMIMSSIYTFQLKQELTGNPPLIRSMMQELKKMTETKKVMIEIHLDKAGNARVNIVDK